MLTVELTIASGASQIKYWQYSKVLVIVRRDYCIRGHVKKILIRTFPRLYFWVLILSTSSSMELSNEETFSITMSLYAINMCMVLRSPNKQSLLHQFSPPVSNKICVTRTNYLSKYIAFCENYWSLEKSFSNG